ncbi:16S rRNA (cytidine(1402)-2'-O)-methyltransferase [Kordiimonas laminariae]|uniref:16S rRNA (cytidine(1402)-2'-O)-methyltransferase n=1 Tax=Kordiimonas laminariae TaxID=2917717 RepID=UPI001FF55B7E|nr:16S rRNA (cytidine(1402)-2'-O)-methyltransferase [Kordiimonas laminariae]MCK0070130.1 16S rRNA (cytidine(1402)-2'-O)-methyltransferase [Kordiimonas laminariae]
MAEIRSGQKISAGLYIVATPIGNLGDVSKRANEILSGVNYIACEDTRVTAKLLSALLLKKPLIQYHEHNGEIQRPKILGKIAEGASVALVSDAGTPLISDPGYKLVDEAREAGHRVTAIPGPCALVTALSLAGLPTDRFMFMGFPPNKTKARTEWFEAEKNTKASLIFYESAKRLPACLEDAASVLEGRKVAVCRELTKKFEEVVRGNLNDIAAHYAESGPPKGEVVVILSAPDKETIKQTGSVEADTDKLLEKALTYMRVKDAASFVSDLTGIKKKELYNRALELSGKN